MPYTFNGQTELSVAAAAATVATTSGLATSAGDFCWILTLMDKPDLYADLVVSTSDSDTVVTPSTALSPGVILQALPYTVSTWGNGTSTGSTSAVLSANWGSPNGSWNTTFSDAETRTVTFTNGSPNISWTGALTGSPTTAITVNYGQTLVLSYAANVIANAAKNFTSHITSGSHIYGTYGAGYTGLPTSGISPAFSGSSPTGSGTVAANGLSSGALSGISVASLQFGFCLDLNGTGAPTAGTSPTAFTGRTAIWSIYGGSVAVGLPEDANVSTNVAATFGTTTANKFDGFLAITGAVALAAAAPSGPSGIRIPFAMAPIAWIIRRRNQRAREHNAELRRWTRDGKTGLILPDHKAA